MAGTTKRKLLFGTAGIPAPAKGKGTVAGLDTLVELGLDAMEIEFVRGVRMGPEVARDVRIKARSLKIYLTAHAPYWLNLNSADPKVVRASEHRILDAARVANTAGAKSLAFHAAYYCGMKTDEVYRVVRRRLRRLVKKLSSLNLPITLSPELTGRPSQFGSIEEMLLLCSEVPSLRPCMDFAHIHARTGKWNTYEEFCELISITGKYLGRRALNRMHIHVAGIDYGPKGERKHLNLRDSDFDFEALLAALKHNRVGGVVVCESPNLEEDALLLKQTYRKLK